MNDSALPPDLGAVIRTLQRQVGELQRTARQPLDMQGLGDPEGVVAAPVGATWRRTVDGTPGATFYVKETDVSLAGTSTTGWVAK